MNETVTMMPNKSLEPTRRAVWVYREAADLLALSLRVAQLLSVRPLCMHQILSKRIEIPWLSRISRRALIQWLIWLGLSLWTWHLTHLINMGLYPDYDERLSSQMAFQTRIILMTAWVVWILSLFVKSRLARLGFVFGVCLAFSWEIIRLNFMREVISILNL